MSYLGSETLAFQFRRMVLMYNKIQKYIRCVISLVCIVVDELICLWRPREIVSWVITCSDVPVVMYDLLKLHGSQIVSRYIVCMLNIALSSKWTW